MLRKTITSDHPVVGEGYRLLEDDETLLPTDETCCVSCLLSRRLLPNDPARKWVNVADSWADDIERKLTVGEILGPDSLDADANERVFRRREA